MATKKPVRATIESLMKKPPRTKEVTVKTVSDTGRELEINVLFRSLGSKLYDAIVTEHQPTKEQKKEGNQWNPDTFPPALIAACSVDPRLTVEQATSLWESEDWSQGELMGLFIAAVKLNNEGLDIPFTAAD